MSITINKKAPAIKGIDQNGETIELKNYIGKKVAIYFYPQDDTPTCTVQACNLRDNFLLLQQHNIQVIGISVDTVKSHKKFETKYNLPFPLIADEGKIIVEKYGVWKLKKFMGKEYVGLVRTTFLIDETGKLIHIIEKPKSKLHAEEIIQAFGL